MNYKNILFIAILLISPLGLSAQAEELYETINYKTAVKNGTRSRDGMPGPNYWQNHADYDIQVKLDTDLNLITGNEKVIYYNESPDSIPQLVLRLYPDRYKKGGLRNIPAHEDNISEGLRLDTLIINGKGISLEDTGVMKNGTNLLIPLQHKIAPSGVLSLECTWSYNPPMAVEFRREGYYKDNAWFVGYFYPQIAVYDDLEYFSHLKLKGWDYYLFHQGLQEYYNDFNNYKVSIQVPEGYYVWATGELQNADSVYHKDIIDRLELARTSDSAVSIISLDEIGKYNPLSTTWKFEAHQVPDFGFGTAPNYIWEAGSEEINGRRVLIDVAYGDEEGLYPKALEIARKTISYYSKEYPGIEYPYSHHTTFNGMHDGGMEFPMVANNDNSSDTVLFPMITAHEIIHNYTPFMLGLNEKRYPFMDEGFTDYFAGHFMKHNLQIKNPLSMKFKNFVDLYTFYAELDNFPLINAYSQVNQYNNFNYSYVKPVMALRFFVDMVGETNFKKAYKEFSSRWEGKHPTPWDMFYTFNDVLEENYNWFWKAWYFDLGYPDLSLELDESTLIVRREGAGSLPVPVRLIVERVNGESETIERSMDVWKTGVDFISINLDDIENVKTIRIDPKSIPDINPSNNMIILNEGSIGK